MRPLLSKNPRIMLIAEWSGLLTMQIGILSVDKIDMGPLG